MKAIQHDITKLQVDAIVNAANSSLLGGGGVDGAIHHAAGPELIHECRLLDGCKTGQAKLTKGYNLPSKFIIHTVGPVWNGGNNESELLKSCYTSCIKIAEEHPVISSVAFPCISTGVYRFPASKAASIAIDACKSSTLDITFCCFSPADLEIYEKLLN